MIISARDAVTKYGPIVKSGVWADEGKHCIVILVPEPLAKNLINSATGKPCTHIYVNRDMAKPLQDVFYDIISEGLESLLKTFDGCFMVRDVRGEPGRMSCHTYALAIDLNAATNQLGQTPTMDPRIVAIFKRHGFAWGGDFKRKDGMHFSYGWE